MKISILTPSYNHGQFIEKNITSVINQNWPDVEHIIVDGGSMDNTVDILKKYPHLRWISGQDEGQADALNKGLSMATGDIVGWINSDDYYEKNIFADVINIFKSSDVKWIIGNVICVYLGLNLHIKNKSPSITYSKLLKNPDIVQQQAVFFRKDNLDEIGGWNKKYFMTMDYDLWIRLSKKYTPIMIDKEWAYFSCHPDQKTAARNILAQIDDIKDVLSNQGVSWLSININRIVLKKYYYFCKSLIKIFLIKTKIIDSKFANLPVSISKKVNSK
ncbi:MAG: glycosyltransferase [Ignavibacteriae bacterium]|nr:glycosyltransferase [Ignavibacteriota bacterium]